MRAAGIRPHLVRAKPAASSYDVSMDMGTNDVSALKEYSRYCEQQRRKFMLLGESEIAVWWRNERIATENRINDLQQR